jgi:hypothetical protein
MPVCEKFARRCANYRFRQWYLMSFSTSFLLPSLSIISSNTFPPYSSSSVFVFSSSSAFRAAFFAATLAADRNVDRLGDSGSSGCSGGGDSHLLLLLSLLLSSSAATTFAAALIAAGHIGRLVGDSGSSSSSLLELLVSFGNAGNAATAVLCRHGGCRLLRLWSDGFLFRLKVPVLHGLL